VIGRGKAWRDPEKGRQHPSDGRSPRGAERDSRGRHRVFDPGRRRLAPPPFSSLRRLSSHGFSGSAAKL